MCLLAMAALVCFAGGILASGEEAPAEETPAPTTETRVLPTIGPVSEQLKPKVGYFRDKNGVLTITNRLQKYQRRKDYVEVEIKYERVETPQEYRKLDAATKYSAATISNLVSRYARHYRLPVNLVYAIIKVESGFNARAESPKGACGLMQLMPGTAAEMGVTDIFDPAQNIAGGTQYLAKLLRLFKYDRRLALAAYNAGPNVVARYGDVPPFDETENYVKDVLGAERQFTREGIRSAYVAQRGEDAADSPTPPIRETRQPEKKYYTIHFRSGLTQPAEAVTDEGPYYCIRYGNRVDLIRKEHVARIEEPA